VTAHATLEKETVLTPDRVINLDAYPILDDNNPERAEIIAKCKHDLDTKQYCVLPDFILPEARKAAVEQALAVEHLAHLNCADRNCYLQRSKDASLPEDHARNVFLSASMRMLAYDLLPAESPLKVLYHWEATKRFIAEIVGVEKLYDNEDAFQPVNTVIYHDGDRSAWHFDSVNAFTMTLMLQAPEKGGRFEMAPHTRSDDDQNYDYVGKVVRGEIPEDTVEVGREEGALCIFRGCNSLHRVSPVEGDRRRIMGVFVYENEPGITGDAEVNATVYGPRAA